MNRRVECASSSFSGGLCAWSDYWWHGCAYSARTLFACVCHRLQAAKRSIVNRDGAIMDVRATIENDMELLVRDCCMPFNLKGGAPHFDFFFAGCLPASFFRVGCSPFDSDVAHSFFLTFLFCLCDSAGRHRC